ncbi:NTP transferase domain-containing protein [Arthrobacter sp. ISL-28]|nr:NTP transferase domain-containing protein [Arthrobacter sp. ISL-28]
MTSTRLPGKVLMPLAGRPILDWVFRAGQSSSEIDEVVLATSVDASDDVLERFASSRGITCVRGALDDVLGRFLLAADAVNADAVVRLTADCPLLDPALIDSVAGLWRRNMSTDYVSTTLQRSLPRGLDVECVRAGALRSVDAVARGYHRTHVTSLLYAAESRFSRLGLVTQPDCSHYRVTVDTPLDLEALRAITDQTGDRIVPWRELIQILGDRPGIPAINGSVRQKEIVEG